MLKELTQIFTGSDNEGEAKGPSLDTILEPLEAHLENFDTLIEPAPESNPRTPFDSGLPKKELSTANLTPKQIAKLIPIMAPLMLGMQKGALMYDGKFKPTKSEASSDFIAELEDLAQVSGVSDIAYVKVPNYAIFKDKGIPHPYAIVFTVEMDKEPIDTAPSFDAFREVAKGYKNLAVIGNKLAKKMQKAGFAAYPGTALGGITDYPHLAELAGLGAIGYHGLLISPHEGARLRINTIYTNITNLPIKTENEHAWVRDVCAQCKKCVRSCPADAIYSEPKPREDGGKQCIEHDSCRKYFAANHGCAVCLSVCPFSNVGYDKVKAGFFKAQADEQATEVAHAA